MGNRKFAILVSTSLLLMGWYRSPETSGTAEFASKQKKTSSAIVTSKKISSSELDAALPKSRAAKAPKKVAISFDNHKQVRASTQKFFNKMRVAESGHGDLPIDPPAPTPTPKPRIVEPPVRKRQTVFESYDADPITRESEQSYRMAARVPSRPLRSRSINGVTLIPSGGISYSQFDVQGVVTAGTPITTVDFNARPGYMAGLLLEAGRDTFSFQTGLVYLQEGVSVRGVGNDPSGQRYSVDGNIKIHYIGLPILAKISTGSSGETRVSVKGGVIPAYATNTDTQNSTTVSNGVYSTTANQSWSSQDSLRQFNVIGQVGAGVVLPSGGNVDFRFDVLYNRALMPMSLSDTGEKTYSQSVMGVLGMGIPL